MSTGANSLRIKLAVARAVLLAMSSEMGRMADLCAASFDEGRSDKDALLNLFGGCLSLGEATDLLRSIFVASFTEVGDPAAVIAKIPPI